jgi:uncharacterized protein YcbK (DUF882 family)
MIREFVKGHKERLSDHFSTDEFDCHCMSDNCIVTYIDMALIAYLEKKRELWNKPIHIRSGFRCVHHNQRCGGAKGSRHLIGQAADIEVKGMTGKQLAHDCSDAGGVGLAKGWIHVDIRYGKSRWTY